MSSNKVHNFPRPGRHAATLLAACVAVGVPVLGACSATGFGAPTRHAIANLQAADAKLGTSLEIEDAIIALPSGDISAKGGLAYLQFEAINFSNQPDPLLNVSADLNLPAAPPASSASGAASSAAPSQPAATSLQAASDTTVPAATPSGPGTIRISVLLRTLTAPLAQGDSVAVGLTFGNSGSLTGLLVPVQGADVVGTFLPTGPPPAPSSAVASPVPISSAPASSAPAASPASSGSAPASAPASASLSAAASS